MGWLEIGEHLKQHAGEAIDCPRGLAGPGHRERWQGMEGTVYQGVPVEKQKQLFFCWHITRYR